MTRYTLFDTAVGRCGIVWNVQGLVAVQLPEANESGTRSRLLRQFPDAQECSSTADVQQAIEGIVALLQGKHADLLDVKLDMSRVPEFHRRVYDIARKIPVGKTVTYGDIAAQLGSLSLSRAVGQALGANPFVIVVPCHRVVAADGKNGGFSAAGGVTAKLRLLEIEGVQTSDNLQLF